MDPVLNFAKATVSLGYDADDTSIVLATGHGAKFPDPAADGAFNVTWWNITDYPDPSDDPNVEIVRVTARTDDTLTVTRAQEGTGASTKNTAGKTYKMILGFTKKSYDDIPLSHTELTDIGTNTHDIIDAKLDEADNVELTSLSSKGGVFNGGFELGSGDVARTTTGFIEDEKYGWYLYVDATAVSAEFDTSISKSGRKSLKLSLTDVTGNAYITNTPDFTVQNKHFSVPVKIGTLYKYSAWIKTNNAAADAVYLEVVDQANGGISWQSSKLSGNNEWTHISISFTTDTTTDVVLRLRNSVAGNISDVWFDDITLEEVTANTVDPTVASKPDIAITAVSTTDNVDQSQTGTAGQVVSLGQVATKYVAQTFTPTKKKLTSIQFYKESNIGTFTGDVTVQIVAASDVDTPTATILAAKTYSNAEYNALSTGLNTVDLPCILSVGSVYAIKFTSSTADDSNYARLQHNSTSNAYSGGKEKVSADAITWNDNNYDLTFYALYAKLGEQATLIHNGVKTIVQADKDGFLSGSIINLDEGKYIYKPYASETDFTVAESIALANDIYSASAGARTETTNVIINNWLANSGYGLLPVASTAVHNFVIKVNTGLPIKHLKLKANIFSDSADFKGVQVSLDGVNYTTVITALTTQATIVGETDLANGSTVVYVKYTKDSANVASAFAPMLIEADLDTSAIPIGTINPLGEVVSQAQAWKVASTVASYVYRQKKFTTANGIVMPALELNSAADGTGTALGYILFKHDNSQETTPSVKVLADAGAGGIASDTVLDADGEYVALATPIAEGTVAFQIGQGAGVAGITKNVFYTSSDGEGDDATQDPSLQATWTIGVHSKGLRDSVTDIREEVQTLKTDIIPSSFGELIGSGTAYALTTSLAVINFGTSGNLEIRLPDVGIYEVTAEIFDDLYSITASNENYSLFALYKDGIVETGSQRLGVGIPTIAAALASINAMTHTFRWIVKSTHAGTLISVYGKKNVATTGDWNIQSLSVGFSSIRFKRIG